MVNMHGSVGRWISKSNFVTRALVEKLGLTTHNVNVPVVGVNRLVSQIRDKNNTILF